MQKMIKKRRNHSPEFKSKIALAAIKGDQQVGVAFGTHIGGFLAGMALIPFLKTRIHSFLRAGSVIQCHHYKTVAWRMFTGRAFHEN
jgi:hypothetical protein